MNNKKKAISIAIIATLIAACFGYAYIKKQEDSKETTARVVKAIVDIPEGTKLESTMLTYTTVPQSSVVAGVATSADQVLGKFADTTIYSGEQVLTSKLVDQGSGSVNSFAYKVPEGMRTATITISSDTGVSDLLQVGDHVDILLSYTPVGADKKSGTDDDELKATKYILDNIEIGALDTKVVRTTADGSASSTTGSASTSSSSSSSSSSKSSSSSSSSSSTTSYTTVTLFVTPDQVKELVEVHATVGDDQLYLTLRNPNETTNANHDKFDITGFDEM